MQQSAHQRHGRSGERGIVQRRRGERRGKEGEEIDRQESEQPRGRDLALQHELREEGAVVAGLLGEEEAPGLRRLGLCEHGGVKEQLRVVQGYHS